jgi:hypothetical protein
MNCKNKCSQTFHVLQYSVYDLKLVHVAVLRDHRFEFNKALNKGEKSGPWVLVHA